MLGSYKVTNARKNIFTTKLNIGEAKGQTCPVNRPCESRQRLFFRKKTSSTFFLFYCLVCLLIMSCNLGGIITNVASLLWKHNCSEIKYKSIAWLFKGLEIDQTKVIVKLPLLY